MGLRIDCYIIDVRMSWGKVQLQIEPKAGTGSIWVSEIGTKIKD